MPPLTTAAGLAPLAGMINERWLDLDSIRELKKGWRPRTGAPLVIDSFLEEEFARDLLGGLRAARSWRRFCFAYTGGSASVQVSDAAWEATPGAVARYSVIDEPRELVEGDWLSLPMRRSFRRLFRAALMTHDLQRWFEMLLDLPLSDTVSVEFNRLRTGDELRPHQDLHQGRVVNTCIYIDDEMGERSGGDFGFLRKGAGDLRIAPLFNRFVIIPIDPANWHWVEPFEDHREGRECIAIGFNAKQS